MNGQTKVRATLSQPWWGSYREGKINIGFRIESHESENERQKPLVSIGVKRKEEWQGCSICGKDSDASSKMEDFYELELNIKGFSNLDESLDDYLSLEELHGKISITVNHVVLELMQPGLRRIPVKKGQAFKLYKKRREEVKQVLSEAHVRSIEEPFFWISTEWLRQWSDIITPP
ncbi:hypothetical protein HPP92_022880 [Vanilla planifolia]|uniref:Uncharacterized protein n=1 Tax=Vanilla planifolia TaxID=51239 RepID=A0A835PYB9_VANPL|nr:hypothetical protein HPP92_022880 [Vanilla planifolia]